MLSDKRIRILQSRHLRRKNGICLADGLRCCREAIQRRPQWITDICCTEAFRQSEHFASLGKLPVPLEIISDAKCAMLSENETPQGILVILKPEQEPLAAVAPSPFTLILDQVADPGNLGTILRTAWAIGLYDVWLTCGCADPWAPKTIRSGMGAQFAVKTHEFPDLKAAVLQAKTLGALRIWCTMPGKGISIFDPHFCLRGNALVIGNEANGITDPTVGEPVTIPMPGHAESLNAAQAATVFLIESLRS